METLELNILFFGALKAHFGSSMNLSVNKGINLFEVLKLLLEKRPDASNILASCQLAVNSNLVETEYIISESCELAILPPFSGG